jgi:hypothetical protein
MMHAFPHRHLAADVAGSLVAMASVIYVFVVILGLRSLSRLEEEKKER